MSSIRRTESSRANGALSRGPVTEEGKRRVSLNAVRHGLLSMHTVAHLEQAENFNIVVQDHVDCFQPTDGVQEGLIEEMANAYWRTRRLWAMETGMLNRALDITKPNDHPINRFADAFSSLAATPRLQLLNTYEGRLHRRYHRAIQTFLALRNQMQPEPEPQPEPQKETEQTDPL